MYFLYRVFDDQFRFTIFYDRSQIRPADIEIQITLLYDLKAEVFYPKPLLEISFRIVVFIVAG
jgi:hypothetical protein